MMDGDAASFVGYYISLTCENESIYEGEVVSIDVARQLITLTHAHQLLPDGNAVKFPHITLTGNHVKSLKIIRERINVIPFEKEEKAPDLSPKENGVTSESEFPHGLGKPGKGDNEIREEIDKLRLDDDGLNTLKSRKRNSCFGEEADQLAKYPDFNFEANLAKFDKQAIFEKMSTERELDPGISHCNRKMNHQENILESEPVSLRQIKVPLEHTGKEYSTEDGFIVPAITLDLKIKLFSAAEKAGLSVQQLAENAGMCTCQMALQLVGGSLRINPKNDHQRPEIVVLAGAHMQGLQAVCAARHLVNHTAKVVLYLPTCDFLIQPQLDLFLKSGGKLIKTYKDLPTQPVDMIISAMFGMDTSQHTADWLPYAISWANQNKAPLLAIDPCMPETKSEVPDIKWSIAMSLPLIKTPKAGSVYLADIGIPRGVFKDVDIQYMSPFTDKFYIPLYDA